LLLFYNGLIPNQTMKDYVIEKIFLYEFDKILSICDFDHSNAEKNSVLCTQLDDRCFLIAG